MSSQRADLQKEGEEEDFYDCQESLHPPDLRGEEEEQEEQVEEQEQQVEEEVEEQEEEQEEEQVEEQEVEQEVEEQDSSQQEAAGLEDFHIKTKRRTDRTNGRESETGRQQEEEEENSDTEMKEGVAVEFDDDYLREVEKELTEEEKESRRRQSLALKEKGNHQFKAGDWAEAEQSYTEALLLCPVSFSTERAVLFSNRAAARLHQDLKDQAITDCSRAIELNPDYLRALLRRADLYEQTEKLDEALEDYKKVLDRDPNHSGARQACMRLPQQIQERNEKLKEEMLSKLKDLGNMILRPFGLSTNNFQVNQDPDSGSYSINFTQSPNNNR